MPDLIGDNFRGAPIAGTISSYLKSPPPRDYGTGPVKIPLPVSARPYKLDQNDRHRVINRSSDIPIVSLDPKHLIATQENVQGFRMKGIKGAMNYDKPILVIRHKGTNYIEEGHHRVMHAIETGQHVPAIVMKVMPNGKLSNAR